MINPAENKRKLEEILSRRQRSERVERHPHAGPRVAVHPSGKYLPPGLKPVEGYKDRYKKVSPQKQPLRPISKERGSRLQRVRNPTKQAKAQPSWWG